MPTPRQQKLEERNKKWREEYEAGATLQQIADRYDFVNLTAVRNGIVKVGGTMRPTGYRRGEHPRTKRGLLAWLSS